MHCYRIWPRTEHLISVLSERHALTHTHTCASSSCCADTSWLLVARCAHSLLVDRVYVGSLTGTTLDVDAMIADISDPAKV